MIQCLGFASKQWDGSLVGRDVNETRLAIELIIVETGWRAHAGRFLCLLFYFCICCKFSTLKMWGNNQFHSHFLPSSPPFQLSLCTMLVHVSKDTLPSVWQSLSEKLLLFHDHPGQLSPPLKSLIQLLQSDCSFSVWGFPVSVCITIIANTMSLFISPVDSKHFFFKKIF